MRLPEIRCLCCWVLLALPAVPALAAEELPWDAAAAAGYLESRISWWRQWSSADRDHNTKCVSCHTTIPYVLGMPALREQAGPAAVPVPELAMLDDVVKRVYLWDEVEPFYPDQTRGIPKSSESRGVEAVLNALTLATRDQERGYLGADTRLALDNMWAQQMKTGALAGGFAWLNFGLEPFESSSAPYWGATFAALAVARAPDGYAREAVNASRLEALRGYLRTGSTGQSLHTQILVLWADTQLQGILDGEQRRDIMDTVLAVQGSDGGWSLPALADWARIDDSTLPAASDGYATALATLVLQEAGLNDTDAPITLARAWLASHQDLDSGAIPASSINKERPSDTAAYLFMSDVATGLTALVMRMGDETR